MTSASGSPGEDRSRLQARDELGLQALIELSQEIHAADDPFRVAELGLLNFMGLLGTTTAALWVNHPHTQQPVLLRGFGLQESIAGAIGEVCAPKIKSWHAHHPHTLLITDLKEALDPAEISLVSGAGIGLLAPLIARNKSIGALALGSGVSGLPHLDSQLRWLEASLYHLGAAVENTLMFNRMKEQNRELRKAKARLKELDELKQDFLNNTHHELRTPLTIILSCLELVREKTKEDEDTCELVSCTLENACKLRDLVEDLLAFDDIRNNGLTVHCAAQDLVAFLKRYHADRRPGVAKDLRELTIALPAQIPSVRFDADLLGQILDSLLDNAIKFTPGGARIDLRVSCPGDAAAKQVCLEMRDNGPGIPADKLQTVMEPFRQLDGSATRSVGGIGLGLALANELTAQMGGTLELTSEFGKGTVVKLHLPLA